MNFKKFTFYSYFKRGTGIAVLGGALFLGGSCYEYNDRNGNGIDDNQEIIEFTAFMSMLSSLRYGGSSGSSTSLCSTDINNPGSISSTTPQQAVIGSGVICYYKYTSPAAAGQPSINLISTQGNGDLYVGVRNDTTGGTPETTAATNCTPTAPGDGWIRCSKSVSASESLSMNQGGINVLSAGDFRVIAVYANPGGGGSTNFTLLVTD